MNDVDRSLLRMSFWSGLMALVGLAALIVVMTGCMHFDQKTMDKLVGKPYSEAEAVIGSPPIRYVPTPSGRIYTFEHTELLTADDWVEVLTIWVNEQGIITRTLARKRKP